MEDVEIKINIDSKMSITLKLATEMDVTEFTATFMKAKKLLNLSEIDTLGFKGKKPYSLWPAGTVDKLKSLYKQKTSAKEIGEILNIPTNRIHSKIYYLKARGELK